MDKVTEPKIEINTPKAPMITKLMQWVLGLAAFCSLWLALVMNTMVSIGLMSYIIMYLPVIIICFFGTYAVVAVLWRAYHLNDCDQAMRELVKEIEEAREDLTIHGFDF